MDLSRSLGSWPLRLAARTGTGKAARLLGCNLKVTGQDDQDRRALQSDLGRLASLVPEVVTQSLALVEERSLTFCHTMVSPV